MRIFPASLARSIAQSVAATAVGAKGQAGCAAIATAIGASWRLRLRRAGSTVLDMTFQAAMAPAAGVITLPAPTTLLALVDADIATPAYGGGISDSGWVLRIGRSDDAVYVEGAVGPSSSSAPFKLTNSLATSRGIVIGPSMTLRFDPALDAQNDWLQLLRDSMELVEPGRKQSFRGAPHSTAANGGPIPYPFSNCTVSSVAGLRAAVANPRSGLRADLYPQITTVGSLLNDFDAHMAWGWVYAGEGHNAPLTRVRFGDSFMVILRRSTNRWQIAYRGARGQGYVWTNENITGGWGDGQDLLTDANATIVNPQGGVGYELWPYPVVGNPTSIVEPYGVIDLALTQDMQAAVIGCSMTVTGSDRAGAVLLGNIGADAYRSTLRPGGHLRIIDTFGGNWRRLRTDGQKQWIVAVSAFELAGDRSWREPFGTYDLNGTFPYSTGDFGITFAQLQANPPPDMRY